MSAINLHQLVKALDKESHTALERAAETCIQRGGNEILIEDMLLNFMSNEHGFLNAVLKQFDVNREDLLSAISPTAHHGFNESRNPVLSPLLVQWLQEAWMLTTLDMQLREILAGCLILALLKNGERYGHTRYYRILAAIPADRLQQQLSGLIESAGQSEAMKKDVGDSALDRFTRNLTRQARENRIDPVLCREEEIRQLIDILVRRRKNNPIVVGEAGVGKTAVVEGLALKIAQQDVPKVLENVDILTLDMGLLQAGASVKGEFERRLKALIDEVKGALRPIILFIDEAHTLIGAGNQAGGSDAANLLKPALARGELRTIAATTWSEYKKYFEKDPALARRFQPVQVPEPRVDQTVTILRGLAGCYEKDHGVYMRDDAVVAAASLSARFISGRQLPDKAVDILDTACARVKISLNSNPAKLDDTEQEIAEKKREMDAINRDREAGIHQNESHLETLHSNLSTLCEEREKLASGWQQQREMAETILASRQALQELESEEDSEPYCEIQSRLDSARKELEELQKFEVLVHHEVTPSLVAEIISSWTGIPKSTLMEKHSQQVMTFAEKMKVRIKGQDQAIDRINRVIRLQGAGLNEPNAPTGVFLLTGPSGTGKTETALAIADLLYGGEEFLTVINMSEYQEKHSLSRLIGSPPGYVGYGEGGVLTEAVRKKPYSVILLDEVEKADPDIMNLFYQVFDKGVANDGEGRLIDFRNTLILMTSNLGDHLISKACKADSLLEPQSLIDSITPVLTQHFKPALLGRMTVIPYYPIQPETMKELVKIRLDRLAALLDRKQVNFSYGDQLTDVIASRCTNSESGARHVRQLIDAYIMPAISNALLEAMATENPLRSIHADIDDKGDLTMDMVSER